MKNNLFCLLFLVFPGDRCECTEKVDFKQQIKCKTSVCWLKYTPGKFWENAKFYR